MEMPTPRSRGTDSIEILVKMTPAELREAIDILGNAKKLLYTADDTPPDFGKRSYICLAMNSAYREDNTSVFYNLKGTSIVAASAPTKVGLMRYLGTTLHGQKHRKGVTCGCSRSLTPWVGG